MRSPGIRILCLVTVVAMTLGSSSLAVAGPRTVDWPTGTVRVSLDADRIGGRTRYDTAAAIAEAAYPGWTDVTRVIVASGLDRSLADPLAAAGLCWAYDAPLLLVGGDTVPAATRAALEAIISVNTSVTVTVVGSSQAVSADCVRELEGIAGEGSVEQPFAGYSRYDTAALIAARVSEVASASPELTVPDVALVANGTDEFHYYDALALSALSAATGAPVLFVKRDVVPDATAAMLATLSPTEIFVAGSDVVVSEATYAALGATERWYGRNRYATAVAVAEATRDRGWLDAPTFGLAASVPDALVGATYSGRTGAPLLYTTSSRLISEVAVYAESRESVIGSCTVFGSSLAVSDDTFAQLQGDPARPVLLSPEKNALTATYARVQVSVGVNTSKCMLYAGDTLIAEKTVGSYGTVDFGKVAMPPSGTRLRIEVGNPEDGSASVESTVRRLTYPASTCIVIDKSDFRLYFVKGDVLIETYPIAIGRVGMETPVATWKILAKYYTDPSSVYGPRKLRMFRQYGSSFVYTAYAIHGTNEPWVIGTKASHGCVRMYNKDVLDLFPQVALGTLVQTRE